MKNRTQLEADLQSYKNKYETHKLRLKELETFSAKFLDAAMADTNELQDSFLQNLQDIENINTNLQDLQQQISQIQHYLNSRQEHIRNLLHHINAGKDGLPDHWESISCEGMAIEDFYRFDHDSDIRNFALHTSRNSCFLQISEMVTRLVFLKNGMDNNNIEIATRKAYFLENSDGSITVSTCLDIHVAKNNKPDAILVTEYSITNHVNNKPSIKLVVDKAIVCHENAKNYFLQDEVTIEENYHAEIKNIHDTIKNKYILKFIMSLIHHMGNSYGSIRKIMDMLSQHAFLQSVNHEDWLLLHEVLTTFLYKAETILTIEATPMLEKIEQFLADQCGDSASTKVFFYQKAQNILVKVFAAKELTKGLAAMKEELKKSLTGEDFIRACQNAVANRPEDRWNRSDETRDLYVAIREIEFKKNVEGYIDTSCLINLEKYVDQYLHPKMNSRQLENHLQKLINKKEECEREIDELEAPINRLRNGLYDIARWLKKSNITTIPASYVTLLNIIDYINRNEIYLKFGQFFKISLDYVKHEVNVVYQKQNFLIEFNPERITAINRARKASLDVINKDKRTTSSDDEHVLSFLNQTVTYHFNSHELIFHIENHEFNPCHEEIIENLEIPLVVKNQKILLVFKNQRQNENLIKFQQYFSNARLSWPNIDWVPVDTIMEFARNVLDQLDQARLLKLANLYTQEKINEMLSLINELLPELNSINEMNFISSEYISQLSSQCKPVIQKIRDHMLVFVEWYVANIDDSYKVKFFKKLLNISLGGLIKEIDCYQFASLQNKIDEKNNLLDEIQTEIDFLEKRLKLIQMPVHENIKFLLQHLNAGGKGLPNEDYEYWNVNALSSLQYLKNQDFNFNCLTDISIIAAQLVLKRKEIVNKVIDTKTVSCKVLECAGDSHRAIVRVALHDRDDMKKPEAIMVTEFVVNNNKNQANVSFVSVKMILCQVNAENIMTPDFKLIEKKYDTDLDVIHDIIDNDLVLRTIRTYLIFIRMINWPEKSIRQILTLIDQHSLLTSKNHANWFMLQITLEEFIDIINENEYVDNKELIDEIRQFLAALSFYQTAQNLLTELFNSSTPLQPGLELVKEDYEKYNPGPMEFIQRCQDILNKRSGFGRSGVTGNLYKAINAVKFSENEDGNHECIAKLNDAIMAYRNPQVSNVKGSMFERSASTRDSLNRDEDKNMNDKENCRLM